MAENTQNTDLQRNNRQLDLLVLVG